MLGCQFLCLLSFLIKESKVVERAKSKLINTKQLQRAQTNHHKKLNQKQLNHEEHRGHQGKQ